MEKVALARIISTDWTAPCRTSFFCFGCASQVCSHCCERHGHRAAHHPHEAGDPLLVETIGGRLAVDATCAVGCGYDMSFIQRIPSGGRKYILILPVERGDLRCGNNCHSCQRSIRRGARFCSLGCKAAVAEGGPRRPVAQLMVALAAQGQFGLPVHVKDRFCSICRLAYSSASCPHHLLHGHLHPLHAAVPDAVKTIVHFDGWAAIPHGQLPDAFVEDVQALHHPDGLVAYPIHRREHPQPPAAINFIGVGGPHACDRAGCHELFIGMEPFCSLRCRHQAG